MLTTAHTSEEMELLGYQAAQAATPGMVFGLIGDLGAGKTHWTKGFCRGLLSSDPVTSPTFGLLHEYPNGRIPLYHLDFYRLQHDHELLHIGWDEILESPAIIIAEWADKYPHLLPPHTTWLQFAILNDGTREVSLLHSPPTQPLA